MCVCVCVHAYTKDVSICMMMVAHDILAKPKKKNLCVQIKDRLYPKLLRRC